MKKLNKHQTIFRLGSAFLALTFTPLPTLAQIPQIRPIAPNSDPSLVPIPLSPVPPSLPQNTIIPSENLPKKEEPYTLGAGDRLKITVDDVAEYTTEQEVSIDGNLNLPGIGFLSAKGLTLRQLTQLVTAKYSRLLIEPQVTVNIINFRPVTLLVAGEVTKPGSYTLSLTETKQFPRLTQALTLAGGVTQAANVKSIQVRRQNATDQTEIFTLNLWELLNAGDRSQDLTLRDGDTIFIPTVDTLNVNETRQVIDSSFAAPATKGVNVVIVGEVARPGSYSVQGGGGERGQTSVAINISSGGSSSGGNTFPTITRALQIAGGISPLADIRNVSVRRFTRTGTTRDINVNLWQLLHSGDATQDVILQEGDTIIVPTAMAIDLTESQKQAEASFAPNAIAVNMVGEILKPGVISLPPNLPLNQAILAAGGFTPSRARQSKVELIRLNRNGTVSKRTIRIDLSLGVDERRNPPLRNNDVIIVKRNVWTRVSDGITTYLAPLTNVLATVTNTVAVYRLLFPKEEETTNSNDNTEETPPEEPGPQLTSPAIVSPQITNTPVNPGNPQSGGIVSPQISIPANQTNPRGPQLISPIVAPQIGNPTPNQTNQNNRGIVSPVVAPQISPPTPNNQNNRRPALISPILIPQIVPPTSNSPNNPNSSIVSPQITIPNGTPTAPARGIVNPIITVPPAQIPANPNNSGIISPSLIIPQNQTPTNQNPGVISPTIIVPTNPSPTNQNPGIISPTITVPTNPSPTNQNPGITTPNLVIPSGNNSESNSPETTTPQITLPDLVTPEVVIPESGSDGNSDNP